MATRKKLDPPLQPIIIDERGVQRFQANEIVQYVLSHGSVNLNDLAILPFAIEDREQFAQLIGYSVSGIGELSYMRPKTMRRIDKAAGLG